MAHHGNAEPHHRQPRVAVLLTAGLVLLTFVLGALGTWQVQRLVWKQDLIARVASRLAAAPVPPPPRERWPFVNAADDEYKRIALSGVFAHDKEALVTAATERGPGYWVMTPLRQADGTSIFVNRGFITKDQRDPATRTASRIEGPARVTGLLRLSEGGFWILRRNDPAADRWYRRDPVALAQAREVPDTAPFFVDADATSNPGRWPVGGLTVVRFSNSHLVYAITWFVLAALAIVGAVLLWRSRHGGTPRFSGHT